MFADDQRIHQRGSDDDATIGMTNDDPQVFDEKQRESEESRKRENTS